MTQPEFQIGKEIEIEHLRWDIPTLLRIEEGGVFFQDNAHGHALRSTPKDRVTEFIQEQIETGEKHLAMLKRLLVYIDQMPEVRR